MKVIVDRRKSERRDRADGTARRQARGRATGGVPAWRASSRPSRPTSKPDVAGVKVVVHVDGGARGNPGPAAARPWSSTPDGDVLDEARETLGRATNNVAEYRGLLLGLELARALGADEVEVINDSELVAHQINGRLQGQARGPEAAARRGARGAAAASSAGRSARCRARRTRTPTRWSTRRWTESEPEPRPAGGTEYAAYLLIDDLLELQRPLTPGAHDELLFIVVHQAYELWFKLMLHELARVDAELRADRPAGALPGLKRVVAIDRLLLAQLDVLETMGPEGFLEFRDPLAPACGFQSRQFREIEAASAGLWDAFRAGARLPEDREQRIAALADLYRDHAEPLRALRHQLCELLVDHDETVQRWRFHHTLMAAREIGSRPGTGGSRGVEYLRGTVDKRFYDELWAVRVAL